MLSRLYRRLPSAFINYQNFKIMSYPKKSKNPFVYILLLIFTTSFISFTSQFPQTQKKANQAVSTNLINEVTGINYLQCVKMVKGTVDKYLRGGVGDKRVILELSTNNITTANPIVKVYSYLATTHAQHGIDVKPDTLQALENCLTFQ